MKKPVFRIVFRSPLNYHSSSHHCHKSKLKDFKICFILKIFTQNNSAYSLKSEISVEIFQKRPDKDDSSLFVLT